MPIDSIVKRRRADVQRNWAFFLDLFSIALGSGAGTQGALERVTAAIQSGALAEELRRVLNEIRLGSSRGAALRSFAARAKLPDVSTSIELIVQSEELGTELSGMLADQARGFRQTAMQRVEKQALQAPTKMLLPMAVFIFPTILGILIGPVLISYFVSQ
jgi:tight adherence protein C